MQELFDKARFGLPGMIGDDGTMDAGIFEYGAQWVRDTSNTALGALHAGHFELARAALAPAPDQDDHRPGRDHDRRRLRFARTASSSTRWANCCIACGTIAIGPGTTRLVREHRQSAAGLDRAPAPAAVPRRHRHGAQPPRILGEDL